MNACPGTYSPSRSMGSEPSVEEERRVLYLALTRAKAKSTIIRSGDFSAGSSVRKDPDIYNRYFLSTLPSHLVVDKDERLGQKPQTKEKAGSKRFSRPSTRIDNE